MALDFSSLTPEERAKNLQLAQQKRAERIAHFKSQEHLLRQDFKDANWWRELVSNAKGRMPASYIPGTEFKHLRRALKATDQKARDIFGMRMEEFVAQHSDWPAWAIVGLIYEMKATSRT